MKVLIVDDQPKERKLLRAIVESEGFSVLEAADGVEALELLERERADAIISDILMPHMDGYRLCYEVRRNSRFQGMPIIIYTSTYTTEMDKKLSLDLGADLFLCKPSSESIIVGSLRRLISEGRATVNQAGLTVPDLDVLKEYSARLISKLEERSQDLNRMVAELQESETKFRQLLASNIIGVVFWNLEGEILDANDLYLSMLGYTREDLREGRLSCWKLTPPEFVEVGEKAMGELLATATCGPFEKECIRKDGSRVSVLVGSAILEGQEGTGTSFVMDITERKQAAKKLEEMNHQLRFLSHRLFQIQEEERRHLARELHDEIGQTLTAAKINTDMLRAAVPPDLVARLNENAAILDRLLQQTRQISLDLRPPLLDDLGLVPALRWYVDQQAKRAGLEAEFSADPLADDIPPHIQIACFRLAQEAITNVVRHARAKTLTVELRPSESSLRLLVRDDGKGFDVAAAKARAEQGASLGLLGMKERAALAGGSAQISSIPDEGTTVEILLPLGTKEGALPASGIP